MKHDVEERRKYLRLDSAIKVEAVIQDKTAKPGSLSEITALTNNLSVEGICFSSNKKLSPGKPVSLTIHLPDSSRPVHLLGQIKWVRKTKKPKAKNAAFNIGVKLFTVEGSDEGRFMGYVSSKLAGRLGRFLHL